MLGSIFLNETFTLSFAMTAINFTEQENQVYDARIYPNFFSRQHIFSFSIRFIQPRIFVQSPCVFPAYFLCLPKNTKFIESYRQFQNFTGTQFWLMRSIFQFLSLLSCGDRACKQVSVKILDFALKMPFRELKLRINFFHISNKQRKTKHTNKNKQTERSSKTQFWNSLS